MRIARASCVLAALFFGFDLNSFGQDEWPLPANKTDSSFCFEVACLRYHARVCCNDKP